MNSRGVLTCARYAFAPNYYKYCGPDTNRKIKDYLREGVSDPGLSQYLSEFVVLYPYLKLIAQENGIADPYDPRVVEAYWIGNSFLDRVKVGSFVDHLHFGQRLKDKIPSKKLKWVIEKVPRGGKVHHSFHVFSVFTRTGHHTVDHTLDTMDQCRIGWGKIIKSSKLKAQNSKIKIKTQKMAYEDGKLKLKNGIIREINLPVGNKMSKKLKPGDWVSYHWGFVCDKISQEQAKSLAHYTKLNLKLANETI